MADNVVPLWLRIAGAPFLAVSKIANWFQGKK
jgi:hypothetical protein